MKHRIRTTMEIASCGRTNRFRISIHCNHENEEEKSNFSRKNPFEIVPSTMKRKKEVRVEIKIANEAQKSKSFLGVGGGFVLGLCNGHFFDTPKNRESENFRRD